MSWQLHFARGWTGYRYNALASNIAESESLQYCEGVGYCGIASVTDIVLHKSVPVFAEQ